jgi:hypothetical protein
LTDSQDRMPNFEIENADAGFEMPMTQ